MADFTYGQGSNEAQDTYLASGANAEGNNVQCYIKIMSDGKFGVHM